MNLYMFEKNKLSYKKVKFFKWKNILKFLTIQIFVSFLLIFLISKVYDTPKEKSLKGKVDYLTSEFEFINKRISESEHLLQQIIDHDSIIYKSLFEIDNFKEEKFVLYYELDSMSDYGIIKETNERLSRLNRRLDKEAYSLNIILKEAFKHQDKLCHIPAIQPIDNKDLKRTASGWGYRIHPIYKIKKFHYGLDFTAPIGTPIYATGDGTVKNVIRSTSKSSKGYGNFVIIDHGYGYKTLYAHMNKYIVKRNQSVKRGEIIGYVGNTGLSTGPHLHYEVIKNGRKVNPVHYLFSSLTPEEYHKILEISSSIKKSYD